MKGVLSCCENMTPLIFLLLLKELTTAYREEVKRHKGQAEDLDPQTPEPMVGAIRHS